MVKGKRNYSATDVLANPPRLYPDLLSPGRFYKAKNGEIWCCYRVNLNKEKHAQADCIRVSDSRVEYFYLDGRYDEGGKREHCLVEEV